MTEAVQGAYAQVLGLGLLWTSFHCAGMCGPLLCGMDVTGAGRGLGPGPGALRLLLYQAGRGLTYAWLGGLSGLLGAGLRRLLAPAGSVMALALGALLFGLVLRRLLPAPPLRIGPRPAPPLDLRGPTPALPGLAGLATALARAARRVVGDLSRTPRPLGTVMLGAVMGFLPCMLPLWVLGLSALTGSVVHGAALMLLLVAMTTPVLLLVTLLPRLAPVARARDRRIPAAITAAAPSLLMGVSGVWLLLVGCAGLGLIGHAHLGFSLAGRGFLVML